MVKIEGWSVIWYINLCCGMYLQQFASHIFKRNQHVPCETITNSHISLALRPFSIFRPWRVHSLYPCDTWRKLRSPSCHHLASAEAMFAIAWIQGVTRFHLSTNLETGFHRLKMHQKGQNNGKVPLIGGTCVTDSSNKLHINCTAANFPPWTEASSLTAKKPFQHFYRTFQGRGLLF